MTVSQEGPLTSEPNSSHVTPSASTFIVVTGIGLSSVILLAIAGNVLVCIAVYSDRHLRKTNNLFIVSLAVADLLVASLVMPFALANDLLGYWVFDVHFCNVWVSFDIMCSTASILNLCAISADRYIHIKNPLRYYAKMRPRNALIIITAVWFCSFLISFIPISLGWHEAGLNSSEPARVNDTEAQLVLCALEINPVYAILSSCISFYVPCVVMVSLYVRLYSHARMHVKRIKALSVQVTPTHYSTDDTKAVIDSPTHQVRDHKAAITIGVIMGVFLFCWTPFFCVNIAAALCAECVPKVVFTILTWLGYFNSSMNPVIYSIFNTEFRDAFKRILAMDKCSVDKSKQNQILNINSKLIQDKSSKAIIVTELPSDHQPTTSQQLGLVRDIVDQITTAV